MKIFNDLPIVSCLSFLLAVAFSSFISLGLSFAFFILFLGLLIFTYTFIFIEAQNRKTFKIVAIVLLFFSLGMIRYDFKDRYTPDPKLNSAINSKTEIIGIVVEEPKYKNTYREYIIETNNGNKILVKSEVYPEYKYGDRIKFTGKLEWPENFEDNREKTFDYQSFLAKDDIYFILPFAKGEFIESGQGNFLKSSLLEFKSKFISSVQKQITEPASSLLGGILLGLDEISKDWEDIFRRVGIIHIIVLSGYNITLVADAIFWFLSQIKFLTKKFILLFEAVGIVLFVIMVGGAPSVIRAALMALLVLLARGTGRTYLAARALLIAAVAMIILNPKVLIFDTSFQLSFLATAGLIWLTPLLSKKLTWLPEKFAIRNIVTDTISTQILVLPLLLYKTGLFSVVSIPANILILPAVPLAMFSGFITGVVGLILTPLVLPFAFVSELILNYMLKVSEFISLLPFASISISNFPMILMLAIYVIYGFTYWKIVAKQRVIIGNLGNSIHNN